MERRRQEEVSIFLESVITFSPLAAKYMATCFPFPDRDGIDACGLIKGKLRQLIMNNDDVKLKGKELIEPFPTLGVRVLRGELLISDDFEKYFESVKDGGHIMNMYQFYKNLKRRAVPSDVLESVTNHIFGCSPKVANLSEGKVWIYGGSINKQRIIGDYFGDEVRGPYALVHGMENNDHIAIRDVSEEEALMYINFFESVNKRGDFLELLDGNKLLDS